MSFWSAVKSSFGFHAVDEEEEDDRMPQSHQESEPQPAVTHHGRGYDASLPTYAVEKPKEPAPVDDECYIIKASEYKGSTPITTTVPEKAEPEKVEPKMPEPAPESLTHPALDEINQKLDELTSVLDVVSTLKEELAQVRQEKKDLQARCALNDSATGRLREELAAAREEVATLRKRQSLQPKPVEKPHSVNPAVLKQKDEEILSLKGTITAQQSKIDAMNREIGSLRATVETMVTTPAVTIKESVSQEEHPVKKPGRKRKSQPEEMPIDAEITSIDQFVPAHRTGSLDFGYHEPPIQKEDPDQLSLF